MRSEAYQRELRGIAPLLVCVLCLSGCTSKHALPPHFQADFNVVPTSDGIVWWLRISGPQFTAMAHRAASEPARGSVDAIMHRNIDTLIMLGLAQHGLIPCNPDYKTIAILKDGTIQWTGFCPLRSPDVPTITVSP